MLAFDFGLQTASEVRSDLRFGIYGQIAYETMFVWTVQACFGPSFELSQKEEEQFVSTRPVGFAAGKKGLTERILRQPHWLTGPA